MENSANKRTDDNKVILITFIVLSVVICFIVLFSSCSKNEVQSKNESIDYGSAYRYVEVHSGGKTVWKFKGTVNVVVNGDTTVIKTKAGKEHIFVNADVLIKQIDKNSKTQTSKSKQESEISEMSEGYSDVSEVSEKSESSLSLNSRSTPESSSTLLNSNSTSSVSSR